MKRMFKRMKYRILIVIFFLFLNQIAIGQEIKCNNFIFIDANSLISPKNYNEILTNDELLSTQKRCAKMMRTLIQNKPSENFIVVYIFDLSEGSKYFHRVFNSNNSKLIQDSLMDFRQIATGTFSDYHIRVVRLLEQLEYLEINCKSPKLVNLHFFTGGDLFESRRLEGQYLTRFVQFLGIVDERELQIRENYNINLYFNSSKNNQNKKNEIYNYETISY
jgi:hypothetical protein